MKVTKIAKVWTHYNEQDSVSFSISKVTDQIVAIDITKYHRTEKGFDKVSVSNVAIKKNDLPGLINILQQVIHEEE